MNIKSDILQIITNVIGVHQKDVVINGDDILTASPIYASSEDMVYIVMEIMEKYKIRFDACDFDNYAFNTVNKISKIVESHINTKP